MAVLTGVLDDAARMTALDGSEMLAAVASLPGQLRDGWRLSRELTLTDAHRAATAVAVLGMGGSAVGADIVRGVFADQLRVPLVTVRDYVLPAWVGSTTWAFAASYSGATEETISAFASALERRCPVTVITSGGPLGEVAKRAELPLLRFEGGGQPRAAVGYSVMLLAGALERGGVLALHEPSVEAAARAVEAVVRTCGPDVRTESNPAKQLAWALVDRLPVVVGGGFLAPVARRWKTQLNENAETAAVAEELPEATHNTVVGLNLPEPTRDHLYYLFLSSPSDHPRTGMRAALVGEELGAAHVAHQTVPIAGEEPLAQAMAAVSFGDLVSVYLAFLYGVDPTPVEPIGRIKGRLTATDPDADEDVED